MFIFFFFFFRIKVTVLVGVHNFTNENEAGTQRVNVSEANVMIYPKWDIFQLANDIALLKLDHSVKLGTQFFHIK